MSYRKRLAGIPTAIAVILTIGLLLTGCGETTETEATVAQTPLPNTEDISKEDPVEEPSIAADATSEVDLDNGATRETATGDDTQTGDGTGPDEIDPILNDKAGDTQSEEEEQAQTSTADAEDEVSGIVWTFIEDGVDFQMTGVSPEAILLTDGSVRLYVTDMGMKVYRAADGLSFTEESAVLPPGSDPTLIMPDDGTYRMYYVDSPRGTKVISTATSADGLIWNWESSTGISNTRDNMAWGVPDTVELFDGSVRIYWVDMPPPGGQHHYEVIRSAIAADGVNFTYEEGYRTQNGYVDSYVLIAEEGNWIGLFSTTPAPERLPQRIYLGTSTDGLSWSIESEPVIMLSGGNAIDPTAVPLGDGSYRIYYGTTPNDDPFGGFYIKSGVLTLEGK